MKHRTPNFPKELASIKLIHEPTTVLERVGLSPITVRRLAKEAEPIERTITTKGEFIPNAMSYRLIGTVVKDVYSTEATTVHSIGAAHNSETDIYYEVLSIGGWTKGINKEGVVL
jgi:hypothetical protein